jgi:hypothetical protein
MKGFLHRLMIIGAIIAFLILLGVSICIAALDVLVWLFAGKIMIIPFLSKLIGKLLDYAKS